MSMAVVETLEQGAQEDEAAVASAPTFAQLLDRQFRLRFRQGWRYIAIFFRSVFWLEEDSQRDEMIMQNRADIDYIVSRVAHALSGVNQLDERLSAHEDAIPRMRAVKDQFTNTKRVEKEKRDAEIEAAVKAEAEKDERLAAGILS